MKEIYPNFIIVGAAKSGTTALANFVGQHPEIYMSSVKEPFYFVEDPEITKSEYLKLFIKGEKYKARGEASTGYLYDPTSAEKIYSSCGNIRIIISLRYPVDMAHSMWRHMSTHGSEQRTFYQAISNELSPNDTKHAGRADSYRYIDRGMYSKQVARYIERFGRENVYIMVFEEFNKNPTDELRKVFKFLEVETSFTPEIKRINEGGSIRSQLLHRLIHREFSLLKRIVPLKARYHIRKIAKKANLQKGKIETLRTTTRKDLQETYRNDIEELKKITGIDFHKSWNSNEI